MTKKIGLLFLVIFVFAFFSCGISTEELAKQVQASVIKRYKEDNSEIIFNQNLILVHKAGNEYTGGADVSLDGNQMRISINVLSDGKSYSAEWTLTNR